MPTHASLSPLERSGRLKSSLTPLERLDGFIQEQKARREEFWARHRQRACVAATVEELQRDPSKPSVATGRQNDSARHWNPTNCVELERHALRAIAAREDAIQKLNAGSAKVDAHIQLRFGLVLTNDPVLRMFFRLVETVREKTIDAVECAASWERNVGRGQPFLYKDKPYLPNIGEDLKCLDVYTFVTSRFQKSPSGVPQESCSDDPFLCALTPHGIPIEPTSSFVVRQGGRMDSKGLRLRSAVRIVEPRITSASMLTRVTVTPGKLPPLRGRSTTRKTTQGMKKRAATHRDSTRPVSGCGEGAAQKSTEQSPSPEPVHLPTLMGDSKASAAPPQVRQFGPSDTFTPERPAEPGESSATAGPPRVQQRSALSEPPCRTTGHTNATGSGAAADLNGQEAYAQKCGEVSPQGQRPAREMGSIEEDSTEATGKAEVSDETCDEIAADDGGQEGRAEEHVQHASLSEETRAGELNSKECLSAQAFSSEVRSQKPRLTAALQVRTRVRVKCIPQQRAVAPVPSAAPGSGQHTTPSSAQQPVSLALTTTSRAPPALHALQPADNSEAQETTVVPQTLGGVSVATCDVDESEIVLGGNTMLSTASDAPRSRPDDRSSSTAAEESGDRVTVRLAVSSSSGEVCATMNVLSTDAPMAHATPVQTGMPQSASCPSDYVSVSLTPVVEGDADGMPLVQVAMQVHPQDQNLQQQQQAVAIEQSTSTVDASVAHVPPSVKPCEWLEVHLCVNEDAAMPPEELCSSSEKLQSVLNSEEFFVVSFEVIEEVVLVLQQVPDHSVGVGTASQITEAGCQDPSDRTLLVDGPPSHASSNLCRAPSSLNAKVAADHQDSKPVEGSVPVLPPEDALAVDEALEDVLCSLDSLDSELEDPVERSDSICIRSTKEVIGTGLESASMAGPLHMDTAPVVEPVGASGAHEPAVETPGSSTRKVLVSLVPQEGSEWVAVTITAISAAPGQTSPRSEQPGTASGIDCAANGANGGDEPVQGSGPVAVRMEVQLDGTVRLAMNSKDSAHSVAGPLECAPDLQVVVQMHVRDTDQHVEVQMVAAASF